MGPTRVRDVEWATWKAQEPATLVFIVHDDRLLLIQKKRGLGAGKITGPGGRVEPGETLEQCAVREVQEELGVTPVNPTRLGENRFQFVDGYSTHVHVYRASDLLGTPTETDEAAPLWVDIDRVPYCRMWEDDLLWLPLLIEGIRFSGRYVFEGDSLLDHELDLLS